MAIAQATTTEERYCPQCGQSCVPLTIPYISKECTDCGRTIHFIRHAPEGGVKIEAGERFTIPAGFMKLSLDPAARGKLFRPGLKFLLKQLFIGGHPKDTDDIVEFAKELDKGVDEYLNNCQRLDGLNMSKPEDVERAYEILKGDTDSRDWHVMLKGFFCGGVIHSIQESNAPRAAWAGYMLGSIRGLTIVTEPLFEQTLWRGYLANQVVYEAAVAASHTPAEAEALRQLQPLFQKLDEATLHAWVESGLPIGPRIGVTALPEELVKALAKFQLVTIQRERGDAQQAEKDRRDEARQATKDRRENIELKIKWLTLGVATAGAVGAALKVGGWL